MTDVFTSDWHLGHSNVIKHCNRPFANADEMDSILINNLNEVAGPDDRVFNLGDVAFHCDLAKLQHYRSRMVCKNILVILGNHDVKNKANLVKCFNILPAEYMYEKQDYRIVLNHYAMRVWPHSHHGAGHLYGHSHGKLSQMATSDGRGAMAFDVGVDAWNYKPLTLRQVQQEFLRLSATKVNGNVTIDDHHAPVSEG